MILVRRGALTASGLLLTALVAWSRVAPAQDTTWKEGVRITGIYTPGTRPGLLVMPVTGAQGDSLRAIFQRDFENGDRMNVIALAAESVPPAGTAGSLNYPLYSRLGANVILQVTPTSFGIHVLIHDVGRSAIARAASFPLPSPALSTEWRMAVHAIADGIEQQVTGVRGISATRILYASAGRIWQVDSDGHGAIALTGDVRAMSPAWNPKGTHLAYTTLPNSGAQIVIRETGGATRTLGTTPGGPNFSPAFSPDGNTMVYAHSTENGTELWSVNAFGTDAARRITVGRGSDNTSPTFSPDGRRIAFTSNRVGAVQVYTSDADGTNAEPLLNFTVGEQSYRSDPDWSPDGRLIAFASQVAGNFQIMTIGVRDRNVRAHTSTAVNENPSFAPDSRHIVFTSNRSGTRQLWVVDIESGRFRQLTRAPGGARHAAWSPALNVR
ncbi:MAG: PD40 domain-containing protein [Gemmatimonadaceae bacterium]|nr:PD40 domain-containing protein [Gemmatimonadaceae bacterium]